MHVAADVVVRCNALRIALIVCRSEFIPTSVGLKPDLRAAIGRAMRCMAAGSAPILVGRNLFRLLGHDRNAVNSFFMSGETVIPQTRRARIASPIGKRDSGAANQSRTIGRTRLSD